jgi:hypothetical protein
MPKIYKTDRFFRVKNVVKLAFKSIIYNMKLTAGFPPGELCDLINLNH